MAEPVAPPPSRIGGNGRYHVGVWYGQGGDHATPSSDLIQRDLKGEARDMAIRAMLYLSVWVHDYVERHVQPLVDMIVLHRTGGSEPDEESLPTYVEKHILHQAFRDRLQQRAEDHEWLCKEVSVAKEICHPLYNAFAPFVGYSDKAHRDPKDSAPTVLLNFGYTLLHLPEYNAAVELQPGDTVFLSSATVKHYTTPIPGDPAAWDERWAISCFFQKQVHTHQAPEAIPGGRTAPGAPRGDCD